MEKRQLGNSNLRISKIGLGCMSIGTEINNAQKIIEAALEAGINYFDTADLYDYGVNEDIVGKTLSSRREDVIIATKVGNRWNENKNGWSWDPSKDYIKEAVKNSLRRLKTDYIDLYQLHGGTIDDPIEETIQAFEELKEEGFIRYYGISSIRPNVIRKYVEDSSIVSNMMQYSLLDRRPEAVMPLLTEHNISIVTRGSVAKGILSDKTLEAIEADDFNAKFLDYSSEEIKELIESIKAKLLFSRSLNEVALQFNLAHETVASVVTGASSVEQLLDNVRAVCSPPLSQEEIGYLEMITKKHNYTEHI
ncbi:aldo/keto reductase [Lederbergia wuyishanensis]|uniref:Aryl-alcohol dehydrogenase-like predicted oxidoreductase n=1 Tax=Lederbergia wuyishanensis TaxID=1347903 RepID=A0ABU0D138_9BACI|nr:aldo/keto reductase [Lederbergia wuyishanensis]MCJ8006740.1 aldo/keto reductase [Lederbergia wuyishanensis]MDQ0342122.1 aryl-alcohol dehydrogenase-like predicted oxidoreductase [Lederbergia wuyishanensis]